MRSQESTWDGYWADLPVGPQEAIWDTDAGVTVERHLELFGDSLDGGLPMVDVGCGNGTQTVRLGRHFSTVVGVDVSERALDRARQVNATAGVAYRKVDLLDPKSVAALHADLGDANVYERTVIHQLDPAQWPGAASAVATIVGSSGRALLIELGASAHAYLAEVVERFGPPPKFHAAISHGIRPATLKDGDLERHMEQAGLQVSSSGELAYPTTQNLPDGSRMVIPAQYLVVEKES